MEENMKFYIILGIVAVVAIAGILIATPGTLTDDRNIAGLPTANPLGNPMQDNAQSPANAAGACSERMDVGKDYYKRGIVSIAQKWTSKSYGDSCAADNKTLTEYWCAGPTTLGKETYVCPESCIKGACNGTNPNPPTAEVCSETDGGMNFTVKGTMTWYVNQEKKNSTDSCLDAQRAPTASGPTLFELFCKDGKNSATSYTCPNGCVDGACASANDGSGTGESTTACTDSDGGRNYSGQGTTTNGAISSTDSCSDSAYLTEYYCSGTAVIGETHKCQGATPICSVGRCTASTAEDTVCYDSDSGNGPTTSGTVTGTVKGVAYSHSDTCTDSASLTEYVCKVGDKVSGREGETFAALQHTCNSFETCKGDKCMNNNFGTLTVTSNVAGAPIEVDGAPHGRTTATFDLTSGTRSVMVKQHGYEPQTKNVVITKGEAKTENFVLKQVCFGTTGLNPGTQTSVTAYGVTKTDSCAADGKTLTEYYCQDANIASNVYVCSGYTPNCVDGRCTNSANLKPCGGTKPSGTGYVFGPESYIESWDAVTTWKYAALEAGSTTPIKACTWSCAAGYTFNGETCKAVTNSGTCKGTAPSGLGVVKGAGTYAIGYSPTTWSYTSSVGACKWHCDAGYVRTTSTSTTCKVSAS